MVLSVALPLGCTRLDERPGEGPAAATRPTSTADTTSMGTNAPSTSIASTAGTSTGTNPSPLVTASTSATTAGKITAADLALGLAAFSRYCGECHDGRLPTAKPKALAVFDLVDTRWIEKLSTHQVDAAKGRLKGKATDAEKAATAALLDGRAQAHVGEAGRP